MHCDTPENALCDTGKHISHEKRPYAAQEKPLCGTRKGLIAHRELLTCCNIGDMRANRDETVCDTR